MNSASLLDRLAVCSWSLRPVSPEELLARLGATGVRRLQLALDPLREAPAVWRDTAALCQRDGVSIVSGMFGCVGEDYSTLKSIRATGGLAPDKTWSQNQRNIAATALLARELGLKLVTFHAGFLPHEATDPNFSKMLARLRAVADEFAGAGLAVALETGQETADTLRAFLEQLDRPNVGVNFDPANMILYGQGDPVAAVRVLGPWLRQVHIKDARRAAQPGVWGQEVVVGTGEVDWPAFLAALHECGFAGDCCIEREAGEQRAADITAARQFLERLAH